MTIKEAAGKLRKKEISSLELTKAALEQIEKRDGEINAFLEICEDSAIKQAKEIDKKIASGEELHILAGIPAAIKDNILVEGVKCTAGSKILENYIAPYDAAVIRKLKKAGAIIIGKTNLDEFAMGSSTENSAFGPTKNPFDPARVPGGSSGGSAVAVAADECIYALGSDTGGSIRQPAAFCGVVGLKPTYGCVSRYGLIAMASSLDQIGPITKTVEDAKIVFDAIKGKDEMDSTSMIKSEIQNPKSEIKDLKIGIPNEYFSEGLDPKIEKIIRDKILELEKSGFEISGVDLPHTKYALACYYIIMPAEVSANLARYDGIKYGRSIQDEGPNDDLISVYSKTRGEKFGNEVKRRIILGTFALSSGYYEAYYQKAQQVRTLIKKDFERAFEKVDALITPVTPTTAFKLGEKNKNPLEMYLSDVFTLPVNLAGLPAISIPIGIINNLPAGLQIIGRPFEEETILKIAQNIEVGLRYHFNIMRTLILNFYENFNRYLTEWQSEFWIFKIISAILSLWFLFLIIIIIKRFGPLLALPQEAGVSAKIAEKPDKITEEWEKIMQTFEKKDETNLKITIIEADKLLDNILQKAGFQGKDMGERLEKINPGQIKNIDGVWRAHKIRNRIAHESNFKLPLRDAEEAIKNYQKALEELEAL